MQTFGRGELDIVLQNTPRLIIDGGANVGYASVFLANKYPDAQIIAVEPEVANCTLFRKNCSAYPNIELVQGGIWSSNEDLAIKEPHVSSWGFRLMEAPSSMDAPSSEHSYIIKGFTIPDLLARAGKQRVDLLKLDIEGSEERLFSSGYSSWIGRVESMIIETHGQYALNTLYSATKDSGFHVSKSGENLVFTKA